MFTDTSIVNLFPIPIWAHTLAPENAETVNRAVLGLIEQIRAEKTDIVPGAQWQSPNDLQKRPELADLNGHIHTATTGILGHLRITYGSFLITGCWANIMPKGAAPQPRHTHPNNYLSGVYYVQMPEGGDTIVFHDPKPQTNIIAPRVSEPNEHNSRNATLSIRPGTLIMFPAWLPHSVNENQGETDRISVSFNVMFTQFGEEMSEPRWDFDAAGQGQTSI